MEKQDDYSLTFVLYICGPPEVCSWPREAIWCLEQTDELNPTGIRRLQINFPARHQDASVTTVLLLTLHSSSSSKTIDNQHSSAISSPWDKLQKPWAVDLFGNAYRYFVIFSKELPDQSVWTKAQRLGVAFDVYSLVLLGKTCSGTIKDKHSGSCFIALSLCKHDSLLVGLLTDAIRIF